MRMVYRSVAANRATVRGKRIRLLQFKLRQRHMTLDEKKQKRQHMIRYWKSCIKWVVLCLAIFITGIALCILSVQSGKFLLEPKKYLISYNQLEPKIEASTFIDSLFYRLLFYCRYIGAVMMGVGVFNIVLVIVYTFWATNERVKVWNYQKQRHLIINANNGHC